MKPFEKHQTELNYLILSTLAEHEGKALRSKYIKQILDNSYPIEYSATEITQRLRALKNRGIVERQNVRDSVIRIDFYPFGYWSLTDRGKKAYAERNWTISKKYY
jgi:DNA-binding HxlR family transcriptional regulator